jgi:aspartyl-tRNA(Asn)/glutamyl-tRNA(Gln) amidotransferase subunit A
MADPALTRLTLAEAGELIRRRALSPVELTAAVLARITALDRVLNAFTTLVPAEEALAAARAAEREIMHGGYRGPLHGVPAGVKDLIDTAGLRTTYGSGSFQDHVPAVDGAMPERLRAAGAVIIGKTATHELGVGITTNNYFYGPTRNPWDPERVPGGSSGGAAAAVAAELGPLHVGTDGGGSIRFPAAVCGVIGHKPTLGLLSNRGQFGDGNTSFSVPGPLARTVRDAAIVSQALAGWDPAYIYSRPEPVGDLLAGLETGVRGIRVGMSEDLLVPAPEAPVLAAYEATLGRLEALGARLVPVRLPHHELVLPAVVAMFGSEGEAQVETLLGGRPRLVSPAMQRMMEHAPVFDLFAHVNALRTRQSVRQDYARVFCEVDVLLAPTAPFPAPRIDADEMSYTFRCVPYTGAANLVGLPVVALPAGLVDGLPVGVQILASVGGDALALRVARTLEAAAPEHRVQRPPLAV